MEPLPLRIAHPKTYIVDERLASLASGNFNRGRPSGEVGQKGPFWGVLETTLPGGAPACNLARLRMG